jgi:NADPH-dependent curcumin reductase CurA
MRLSIRGFITGDYFHKSKEIIHLLLQATLEGKLEITNKNEQVIPAKFEEIPKIWLMLFEGSNTGKLITKLV